MYRGVVGRRFGIAVCLAALLALPPVTDRAGAQDGPGPVGGADGAGLQVLTTFDDYSNGSLRGQGSWSVNIPGAADGALASDEVPARLSGKALWNQLSGSDSGVRYRGDAYAGLDDLTIARGSTGTVFFELATTRLASTRLHLGLSADPSPGLGMDTTGDTYDLDDFGPELTLEPRGLTARDGGVERVLTGVDVSDDATYRVWMVVDNAASRYSVYVAPTGGARVLLRSGDRTSFAFRSVRDADLETFLHLNDADDVPSADSYLDTLAVDPTGTDLGDPSPRFNDRWSFEDLPKAPLRDRDGWTSSSAEVRVVADPDARRNQVLSLPGGPQSVRRAIPATPAQGTGTVFLRMRRTGDANVSAGTSDVDDAAGYADYRSQLNSQGGSELYVRDGDAFADVGTWKSGGWQCFWLVSDGAADTTSVWTRGGRYRTTTRLPTSEARSFGFRAPTDQPLDRFLARTDTRSGTVLVDDVAVDPTHADLRVPTGDAGLCPFDGGPRNTPVRDPAPALPQPARLTLDLTTFAQLPPAGAAGPSRRANTVAPVPGSTRLAVPALEGPLYTLADDGTDRQVYLDLAEEFPDFVDRPGLGTGFGYVTFAPDFATSGHLYTVHTEAGDALTDQQPTLDSPADTRVQGVVTEWTADDPSAPTFAGTRRQVLRIGFSHFTHGIQQISFDPRARPGDDDYGLLYLGVGDGDETPVFSSRPSRLDAPQGKVLRIDPTPGPGGAPYTVPAGNPYVGTGGALPEVYASGLRNPHRFGWDAVTGRLLLGNIGEKRVDSVYDVRPGDRFGWNSREGHYRFEPRDPTNVYPLPDDDRGFTYPVLQIGRGAGTSLVGGYPYSGRLRALRGHYVFGDIVSGLLRETSTGLLDRGLPEPAFHSIRLVVDGQERSLASLVDGGRVDLRLGLDAEGELYVLSKQLGRVWKVTGATDTAAGDASCRPRGAVVRPPATRAGWQPLHPSLWSFGDGEVRLRRPGPRPSGPRRPWEYAIVRSGPALRSFDLRAQVRIDRTTRVPGRDVVLVTQWTSSRSFAYVHLSSDTSSYAHNGIFVVDHGDRRRVDDQFDGERTPVAAISDRGWHDVRVRHCAGTGETAVYVDGAKRPLFTARDTALGGGRVGFGSYDDFGRVRALRVRTSG